MNNETMTDAQIRQWIDACNHEPARQVLRDFIRLRGEAAPEGLTVADGLIEAAFDDGFTVSKNFPAPFLTDEANREMAWTVGRSLPPYCNDAGERQWNGPTAQAAISVARAALGMPTASPAPVAGDAVQLPRKRPRTGATL